MSHIEPKTYAKASKHKCWKQVMHLEFLDLKKTSTWKIVDLPPGVTPIGYMWIYKITYLANDSIDKLKARL